MCAVEQSVARHPHTVEVAGSTPARATTPRRADGNGRGGAGEIATPAPPVTAEEEQEERAAFADGRSAYDPHLPAGVLEEAERIRQARLRLWQAER